MNARGRWKAMIGYPAVITLLALPVLAFEGMLDPLWIGSLAGLGAVVAMLKRIDTTRSLDRFLEGLQRAAQIDVTEDTSSWLGNRRLTLRTGGHPWAVEVSGGRYGMSVYVDPPAWYPGEGLIRVPRGDLVEHGETVGLAIAGDEPFDLTPGPYFSNVGIERFYEQPIRWGSVVVLAGSGAMLLLSAMLGWTGVLSYDPAFSRMITLIGLALGVVAVVLARWPGFGRAQGP